jgi:dienelactone hydrolase
VVGGHSFGGGTAVRAAQQDTRIKCLISLDPYLFPIYKDILNGKLLDYQCDLPIFILYNDSFHKDMVTAKESDHEDCYKKLKKAML